MISYIYIFCLLPRQTSTAHQCNKVDNQLSAWAMTMSSFEIAKLSAVSTGMGWEREPAYRIISCHNFDSRQKLCKIVTLTTERRWKEKKESARVKWLVLFFIPSFNHIIHHGNCLDPSQTPTTHNTNSIWVWMAHAKILRSESATVSKDHFILISRAERQPIALFSLIATTNHIQFSGNSILYRLHTTSTEEIFFVQQFLYVEKFHFLCRNGTLNSL